MRYLIDTNIISEIRKGARSDANVAIWWNTIDEESIFLSVLVLGEIRRGVERLRPKDPNQANLLGNWLHTVVSSFSDRIVPVDQAVADEWGRMSAGRPVSTIDGLLAATAKVHHMTLVTRNVTDIADLGADFVNPFNPHS